MIEHLPPDKSLRRLEQFWESAKGITEGKGLRSKRRHNMDVPISEVASRLVVAGCDSSHLGSGEKDLPEVKADRPPERER